MAKFDNNIMSFDNKKGLRDAAGLIDSGRFGE